MNANDNKYLKQAHELALKFVTKAADSALHESIQFAYDAGFERGCARFNQLVIALENASCALLDAGKEDASKSIDALLDEVSDG